MNNPLQMTVNWLDVGVIIIAFIVFLWIFFRFIKGSCFSWYQ